ncbi:MAG: pyridoxal-phosphate dependent enzyme [Planctomycetota bacterium]
MPVVTPLLRADGAWVKAEGRQRTGSVKYRLVASRVRAALESGALHGGRTLIEATSGSTGVSLAWVGKGLLFPVELHVYASAAPGKLERMRELGARVVLHPSDTPMSEILREVGRRAASGAAWWLGQYERDAGREPYEALARETLDQIRAAGGPPPRVFACPVGTGGLIQGVGRALRQACPGIRIIAVEPAEGVAVEGMRPFTRVHLGAEDPFDLSFPDEVARVEEAPGPTHVHEVELGESAAATLALVRSRGWTDALVIAAD